MTTIYDKRKKMWPTKITPAPYLILPTRLTKEERELEYKIRELSDEIGYDYAKFQTDEIDDPKHVEFVDGEMTFPGRRVVKDIRLYVLNLEIDVYVTGEKILEYLEKEKIRKNQQK